MNADYLDLKTLQSSRGFQKLQALWAHQYGLVMIGLQKSAAKGTESYWRYQAGILKGYDLAIGQLERSILQMEKEGEADNPGTMDVEALMNKIRGDK